MDKYDIYGDIEKRTNGDIYIGVVGPVRTGKSTFVSKFMQLAVIPNITDISKKQVAIDEIPQSSDGKTIMTTEPKFVPSEAVNVSITQGASARVRLIDCVGYMVNGSLGSEEEGKARLVSTPWSDQPMPFDQAGEYGTQKVIQEHSTIGIVVTTDGSFTGLNRSDYESAEERVINELKELGKPFAILLNVSDENSEQSKKLKTQLEQKYNGCVLLKNATKLNIQDISEITSQILLEFPVNKANVELPKWMRVLDENNAVIDKLTNVVKQCSDNIRKMRDYTLLENAIEKVDCVEMTQSQLNLGEGVITIQITPKENLFYEILSNEAGEQIDDRFTIMRHICSLKNAKQSYEKLKSALEQAEQTGYGIVAPCEDEIVLSQPEMVKNGNNYGVKIKATAPSLHIVKVEIGAEMNSVVGKEQQCKEYVDMLKQRYEEDHSSVMSVDLFGRPIYSFVSEEIFDKAGGMKTAFREKLRKTVAKIVNEKKTALFCVTL